MTCSGRGARAPLPGGAPAAAGPGGGLRRLDDPDAVAVGIAHAEHARHARGVHQLLVDGAASRAAEALVLGRDVLRLDADRPAAGLAAHARVEREARGRAGRRALE